jgi:transketolase
VRTAFVDELCRIAEDEKRLWLVCGDLGYSVLETFADRFPERYLNVGVAEQNMVGVAAGLALSGKVVFVYSIANFATMRCLEQIRNDVCYHRLPVTVVAVGGGLAYGTAGYTHHALEDLAVMRALPGMVVVAPGDPVEARLATRALATHLAPGYLRLGKAGEPVVHVDEPRFELGRAIRVRDGADVTLVSTGGMLARASAAADLLADAGYSTRLLSMPTVSPLDVEAVHDAAATTRLVCVVEEHGPGGLGDAIGAVLAESGGSPGLFLRVDVDALLREGTIGSQEYLVGRAGLDPASIAARVAGRLEQAEPPSSQGDDQ